MSNRKEAMASQVAHGGVIELCVDGETLPKFTTVLQSGIFLEGAQGITIGNILTTLPGFSEEYIDKWVQTIFLNGLPADDLSQKIYGDDAVLALSAAMPGLAGAIFRKGGVHAPLRTTSYDSSSGLSDEQHPVRLRIKLFNLIGVEKGTVILEKGCIMMAHSLERFINYRIPLITGITQIKIDDQHVDFRHLLDFCKNKVIIEL